jgi:hypothetical protein
MNYQEQELYQNVNRIVTETNQNKFEKTVRGLLLDKVEFIFSTDSEVIDDNYIIIKGKKENCLISPLIRQKLLCIYKESNYGKKGRHTAKNS